MKKTVRLMISFVLRLSWLSLARFLLWGSAPVTAPRA